MKRRRQAHLEEEQLKKGILNGSIPSGVSNTGATSTTGKENDPFEQTNIKSNKIFHLPTGSTTAASKIAKLCLNVRKPAKTVDIVPELDQTLLSGSKFADAGYTVVNDKNEVNFYDAETVKIDTKAII